MVIVLCDVTGRLGETMIERAQARTRNMGNHAVEDLPALLVLVEAPVQKLAQEPPAL